MPRGKGNAAGHLAAAALVAGLGAWKLAVVRIQIMVGVGGRRGIKCKAARTDWVLQEHLDLQPRKLLEACIGVAVVQDG